MLSLLHAVIGFVEGFVRTVFNVRFGVLGCGRHLITRFISLTAYFPTGGFGGFFRLMGGFFSVLFGILSRYDGN